uniref:Putative c2h2-type zn-finger protein n=1 Tax=Culex tarsalis TaxID=7177 RepID=A0A1Q3EXK0_CULTA
MDTINQEYQPSSSSPKFCAFCLHAQVPGVEFYSVESSTDLQATLGSLFGQFYRLDYFIICAPCWKIAQLFHDFRQRCLEANKLVDRIGQGLGNEDDWFSERNVTFIESIRMVIKDQLQDIGKLAEDAMEGVIEIKSEIFEVKSEPIDEDLNMSDELETGLEFNQVEIEETAKEAVDISEIKVEPDGATEKNVSHKPISKRIQHAPTFICPECPVTFTSHQRLAAHVIKHSEFRPFKCRNDCEKTFASGTNRRKHERRCGKEVYQCNLCEVQLNRRRSLHEHYKLVHPGEPQHPCSYCEKRFKKKEQRQRHEKRIHSGNRERDLSCQHCGRTFAESGSLKRHMKSHDQGEST